jgi:anaerobic magnesium-protoporphyrin IX monomethyl ester cyclase
LEHHRPGNIFQFEITADILHPDIIRFIQEHVPPGLFRFEIGIQSVNAQVNLEVSRKQNFEKTKGIIQALQHKVEMHLDLIVGLPLETLPDIRHGFTEVFKLFAPELQLGFLKFLKGTPVREKYEQHGFVFDPEPPYEVIESNYLSQAELDRIRLVEHALEIYWNKPRAIRTLKYVTERYHIFDFLEGLGEWFGQAHPFHQYTQGNAYERLLSFVQQYYPEDIYLPQLIELDYCTQQKSRPKPLLLPELDPDDKADLIASLYPGSSPKARFLAFALSFDPELLDREHRLEPGNFQVLLMYEGQQACVWKGVEVDGRVSPVAMRRVIHV